MYHLGFCCVPALCLPLHFYMSKFLVLGIHCSGKVILVSSLCYSAFKHVDRLLLNAWTINRPWLPLWHRQPIKSRLHTEHWLQWISETFYPCLWLYCPFLSLKSMPYDVAYHVSPQPSISRTINLFPDSDISPWHEARPSSVVSLCLPLPLLLTCIFADLYAALCIKA